MSGDRARGSERAGLSRLAALGEIGLVDHHAHAVPRTHPRTLDEFRGLFSQSADPRQWPHMASSLSYRRAIADLAEALRCGETERAVYEQRLESDPAAYASSLLRLTGLDVLLLDDGFPRPELAFGVEEMAELGACRARPVLRLERVAEEAMAGSRELGRVRSLVRSAVAGARAAGYAGLKTVAAYRTGLDIEPADAEAAAAALASSGPRLELLLWDALEANTTEPLPVQVHAGFGDGDLLLPAADPALLKGVLEAFPDTPFVLLHCYPYVREAGWLAHVYANVFFDISLTIPYVSRPEEALRQALELAPVSKLLYASDAARAPELYYVAAKRWREALAAVVSEDDARAILRENALALYRLGV